MPFFLMRYLIAIDELRASPLAAASFDPMQYRLRCLPMVKNGMGREVSGLIISVNRRMLLVCPLAK